MQLVRFSVFSSLSLDFQYPRSDRRRCNYYASGVHDSRWYAFSILGRIGGDATILPPVPWPPAWRLSVSSVGSEAMQHSRCPAPHSDSRSFSILGRIGGDATGLRSASLRSAPGAFSILGRIGGDATHHHHPQRHQGDLPFSILGRIGGDATTVAASREVVQAIPFSILGRIGGDATRP